MADTGSGSRSGRSNFNIPRIKKTTFKDNIQPVDINNRDVQNLLRDVHKQCLDTNFSSKFQVVQVAMVHNTELLSRYIQKRTEMKDEGRSGSTLSDQLGFLHLHPKDKLQIAKEGLTAKPQLHNRLGKGELGVYLNRFFDVEVKHTWQKTDKAEIIEIFVFKYFPGKCKSVTIGNLYTQSSSLEPTPNYDSHISNVSPKPSDSVFVQRARSCIYLYEYTEDCEPSKHPRQCLPFAIIKLKKEEKAENAPETVKVPKEGISAQSVSGSTGTHQMSGKSCPTSAPVGSQTQSSSSKLPASVTPSTKLQSTASNISATVAPSAKLPATDGNTSTTKAKSVLTTQNTASQKARKGGLNKEISASTSSSNKASSDQTSNRNAKLKNQAEATFSDDEDTEDKLKPSSDGHSHKSGNMKDLLEKQKLYLQRLAIANAKVQESTYSRFNTVEVLPSVIPVEPLLQQPQNILPRAPVLPGKKPGSATTESFIPRPEFGDPLSSLLPCDDPTIKQPSSLSRPVTHLKSTHGDINSNISGVSALRTPSSTSSAARKLDPRLARSVSGSSANEAYENKSYIGTYRSSGIPVHRVDPRLQNRSQSMPGNECNALQNAENAQIRKSGMKESVQTTHRVESGPLKSALKPLSPSKSEAKKKMSYSEYKKLRVKSQELDTTQENIDTPSQESDRTVKKVNASTELTSAVSSSVATQQQGIDRALFRPSFYKEYGPEDDISPFASDLSSWNASPEHETDTEDHSSQQQDILSQFQSPIDQKSKPDPWAAYRVKENASANQTSSSSNDSLNKQRFAPLLGGRSSSTPSSSSSSSSLVSPVNSHHSLQNVASSSANTAKSEGNKEHPSTDRIVTNLPTPFDSSSVVKPSLGNRRPKAPPKKPLLPLPVFNADGTVSNVLRGFVDGAVREIKLPPPKQHSYANTSSEANNISWSLSMSDSEQEGSITKENVISPDSAALSATAVQALSKNLLQNLSKGSSTFRNLPKQPGKYATIEEEILPKENTALAQTPIEGELTTSEVLGGEKSVSNLLKAFQKGVAAGNVKKSKDTQNIETSEDAETPDVIIAKAQSNTASDENAADQTDKSEGQNGSKSVEENIMANLESKDEAADKNQVARRNSVPPLPLIPYLVSNEDSERQRSSKHEKDDSCLMHASVMTQHESNANKSAQPKVNPDPGLAEMSQATLEEGIVGGDKNADLAVGKPLPASVSMRDLGIDCYLLALGDMKYQPSVTMVDYIQATEESYLKEDCKICKNFLKDMMHENFQGSTEPERKNGEEDVASNGKVPQVSDDTQLKATESQQSLTGILALAKNTNIESQPSPIVNESLCRISETDLLYHDYSIVASPDLIISESLSETNTATDSLDTSMKKVDTINSSPNITELKSTSANALKPSNFLQESPQMQIQDNEKTSKGQPGNENEPNLEPIDEESLREQFLEETLFRQSGNKGNQTLISSTLSRTKRLERLREITAKLTQMKQNDGENPDMGEVKKKKSKKLPKQYRKNRLSPLTRKDKDRSLKRRKFKSRSNSRSKSPEDGKSHSKHRKSSDVEEHRWSSEKSRSPSRHKKSSEKILSRRKSDESHRSRHHERDHDESRYRNIHDRKEILPSRLSCSDQTEESNLNKVSKNSQSVYRYRSLSGPSSVTSTSTQQIQAPEAGNSKHHMGISQLELTATEQNADKMLSYSTSVDSHEVQKSIFLKEHDKNVQTCTKKQDMSESDKHQAQTAKDWNMSGRPGLSISDWPSVACTKKVSLPTSMVPRSVIKPKAKNFSKSPPRMKPPVRKMFGIAETISQTNNANTGKQLSEDTNISKEADAIESSLVIDLTKPDSTDARTANSLSMNCGTTKPFSKDAVTGKSVSADATESFLVIDLTEPDSTDAQTANTLSMNCDTTKSFSKDADTGKSVSDNHNVTGSVSTDTETTKSFPVNDDISKSLFKSADTAKDAGTAKFVPLTQREPIQKRQNEEAKNNETKTVKDVTKTSVIEKVVDPLYVQTAASDSKVNAMPISECVSGKHAEPKAHSESKIVSSDVEQQKSNNDIENQSKVKVFLENVKEKSLQKKHLDDELTSFQQEIDNLKNITEDIDESSKPPVEKDAETAAEQSVSISESLSEKTCQSTYVSHDSSDLKKLTPTKSSFQNQNKLRSIQDCENKDQLPNIQRQPCNFGRENMHMKSTFKTSEDALNAAQSVLDDEDLRLTENKRDIGSSSVSASTGPNTTREDAYKGISLYVNTQCGTSRDQNSDSMYSPSKPTYVDDQTGRAEETDPQSITLQKKSFDGTNVFHQQINKSNMHEPQVQNTTSVFVEEPYGDVDYRVGMPTKPQLPPVFASVPDQRSPQQQQQMNSNTFHPSNQASFVPQSRVQFQQQIVMRSPNAPFSPQQVNAMAMQNQMPNRPTMTQNTEVAFRPSGPFSPQQQVNPMARQNQMPNTMTQNTGMGFRQSAPVSPQQRFNAMERQNQGANAMTQNTGMVFRPNGPFSPQQVNAMARQNQMPNAMTQNSGEMFRPSGPFSPQQQVNAMARQNQAFNSMTQNTGEGFRFNGPMSPQQVNAMARQNQMPDTMTQPSGPFSPQKQVNAMARQNQMPNAMTQNTGMVFRPNGPFSPQQVNAMARQNQMLNAMTQNAGNFFRQSGPFSPQQRFSAMERQNQMPNTMTQNTENIFRPSGPLSPQQRFNIMEKQNQLPNTMTQNTEKAFGQSAPLSPQQRLNIMDTQNQTPVTITQNSEEVFRPLPQVTLTQQSSVSCSTEYSNSSLSSTETHDSNYPQLQQREVTSEGQQYAQFQSSGNESAPWGSGCMNYSTAPSKMLNTGSLANISRTSVSATDSSSEIDSSRNMHSNTGSGANISGTSGVHSHVSGTNNSSETDSSRNLGKSFTTGSGSNISGTSGVHSHVSGTSSSSGTSVVSSSVNSLNLAPSEENKKSKESTTFDPTTLWPEMQYVESHEEKCRLILRALSKKSDDAAKVDGIKKSYDPLAIEDDEDSDVEDQVGIPREIEKPQKKSINISLSFKQPSSSMPQDVSKKTDFDVKTQSSVKDLSSPQRHASGPTYTSNTDATIAHSLIQHGTHASDVVSSSHHVSLPAKEGSDGVQKKSGNVSDLFQHFSEAIKKATAVPKMVSTSKMDPSALASLTNLDLLKEALENVKKRTGEAEKGNESVQNEQLPKDSSSNKQDNDKSQAPVTERFVLPTTKDNLDTSLHKDKYVSEQFAILRSSVERNDHSGLHTFTPKLKDAVKSPYVDARETDKLTKESSDNSTYSTAKLKPDSLHNTVSVKDHPVSSPQRQSSLDSPTKRDFVNQSREKSPFSQDREVKSRSESSGRQGRGSLSRSASPENRDRKHSSWSRTPDRHDRKKLSRSKSPIRKEKEILSRSNSSPLRGRETRSRSASPTNKTRYRHSRSRSKKRSIRDSSSRSLSPQAQHFARSSYERSENYRSRRSRSLSPHKKTGSFRRSRTPETPKLTSGAKKSDPFYWFADKFTPGSSRKRSRSKNSDRSPSPPRRSDSYGASHQRRHSRSRSQSREKSPQRSTKSTSSKRRRSPKGGKYLSSNTPRGKRSHMSPTLRDSQPSHSGINPKCQSKKHRQSSTSEDFIDSESSVSAKSGQKKNVSSNTPLAKRSESKEKSDKGMDEAQIDHADKDSDSKPVSSSESLNQDNQGKRKVYLSDVPMDVLSFARDKILNEINSLNAEGDSESTSITDDTDVHGAGSSGKLAQEGLEEGEIPDSGDNKDKTISRRVKGSDVSKEIATASQSLKAPIEFKSNAEPDPYSRLVEPKPKEILGNCDSDDDHPLYWNEQKKKNFYGKSRRKRNGSSTDDMKPVDGEYILSTSQEVKDDKGSSKDKVVKNIKDNHDRRKSQDASLSAHTDSKGSTDNFSMVRNTDNDIHEVKFDPEKLQNISMKKDVSHYTISKFKEEANVLGPDEIGMERRTSRKESSTLPISAGEIRSALGTKSKDKPDGNKEPDRKNEKRAFRNSPDAHVNNTDNLTDDNNGADTSRRVKRFTLPHGDLTIKISNTCLAQNTQMTDTITIDDDEEPRVIELKERITDKVTSIKKEPVLESKDTRKIPPKPASERERSGSKESAAVIRRRTSQRLQSDDKDSTSSRHTDRKRQRKDSTGSTSSSQTDKKSHRESSDRSVDHVHRPLQRRRRSRSPAFNSRNQRFRNSRDERHVSPEFRRRRRSRSPFSHRNRSRSRSPQSSSRERSLSPLRIGRRSPPLFRGKRSPYRRARRSTSLSRECTPTFRRWPSRSPSPVDRWKRSPSPVDRWKRSPSPYSQDHRQSPRHLHYRPPSTGRGGKCEPISANMNRYGSSSPERSYRRRSFSPDSSYRRDSRSPNRGTRYESFASARKDNYPERYNYTQYGSSGVSSNLYQEGHLVVNSYPNNYPVDSFGTIRRRNVLDPAMELDYYTSKTSRCGMEQDAKWSEERHVYRRVGGEPGSYSSMLHQYDVARSSETLEDREKRKMTVKQLIISQMGIAFTEMIETRLPYPLNVELNSEQYSSEESNKMAKESILACAKQLGIPDVPIINSVIEPRFKQFGGRIIEKWLEEFSDDEILLEVNVIKQCQIKLEQQQNGVTSASSDNTVELLQQKTVRQMELLAEIQKVKTIAKGKSGEDHQKQLSSLQAELFEVQKEHTLLMKKCVEDKVKKAKESQDNQSPKYPAGMFAGDELPEELRVPVPTTDFTFSVPKAALAERDALNLKSSLEQAAGDLLELYKCTDFGRAHFRVPELLLLEEEKTQWYSRGGCFLVLKAPLPKKVFIRLLVLKGKIVSSSHFMTFAEIKQLVSERSTLLNNYVGNITKKRVKAMEALYQHYQACRHYMKDVLGSEGLKKMPLFETYFRSLAWHAQLLEDEEIETLNTNHMLNLCEVHQGRRT